MNPELVVIPLIALLVSIGARFVPAPRWRQLLLLAASYFMYVKLAGPGFLILLIASSLMNFGWGVLLRRRSSAKLLWAAIGANALLLAFFKYLPALVRVWPEPFSGVRLVHQIVLPLGISFWTFQALSYLFEIYLEEELDPSILEFCLYMAFWPTVALGPVCRLTKMLPQFRKLRRSAWEDVSVGIVRLVQGLFMKMVLAQLLADGLVVGGGVIAGFDAGATHRNALDVWALAIGYGFQLFFDFAGYSHIVIGAARLFGIQLEENFNQPYLARTPAIFWTRWHMSLSSWIRNYLYMPLSTLGRNRLWRYMTLVFPMVIFGFWHDAKVTLVLWGLYNGLLLVGHRLGQQLARRIPFKLPGPLAGFLSWAATFLLVCLSYVFFRANDLGQALRMFRTVWTPNAYWRDVPTLPADYYVLVVCMVAGYFAFVGLAHLLQRTEAYRRRTLDQRLAALRSHTIPAGRLIGWSALWMYDAVASRKWWVLVPTLALMLMIIGMSIMENSTMAPFVYQHF